MVERGRCKHTFFTGGTSFVIDELTHEPFKLKETQEPIIIIALLSYMTVTCEMPMRADG